jgi:hypothetical protein
MKAVTMILAGGVAAAALVSAAPASAQYYPGYGYGGNPVGQVLNQVLGGGYGNGYGNGYNQQALVNQCAAAVQQRLSAGGYGGYGYNGYNNGSGYNGYNNGYGAGGRVLGISRVEPRSGGGVTVRGVASSGRYAGYNGYGYNGQVQGQVDLTWKCRTDYRGYISDIDINRAQRNYGSNYGYTPQGNDYSQYGYRRY